MAQQVYYPLIKHGFQEKDPYSLPVAGADTLGGVKVGSGLSIDANGVLSASGGGGSSPIEFEIGPVNAKVSISSYNCLAIGPICFVYAEFNVSSSLTPGDSVLSVYTDTEYHPYEYDIKFLSGFNMSIFNSSGAVLPSSLNTEMNNSVIYAHDNIPTGSYFLNFVLPANFTLISED